MKTLQLGVDAGASLSVDGRYRYRLWRIWDTELPRMTWLMLNPSTADATHDDPTIRRCMSFAKRWQKGGIEVVNLCPLRSTNPDEIEYEDEPTTANVVAVMEAIERSDFAVAAWGAHPLAAEGWRRLCNWIDGDASGKGNHHPNGGWYTLGLTRSGQPRHPLYVASTTKPLLWWVR